MVRGGDDFVDPYIFNLLFWFDGADTSSEARTLADAYGFGEDRNNIAYSTKVFKNKAKDVGQGQCKYKYARCSRKSLVCK